MPEKNRKRKAPMPDITPPREEPGPSEEVLMSGRIYYAEDRRISQPDRQYLASPEDKVDLQHGAVTWIDAALSDKNVNEELDRRLDAILREHKKQPPEYEI
jgi:hypothetical protein